MPYVVLLDARRNLPFYFASGMMRKGSIVVDAGAFPGDFTVLAARIVGDSGKVIALEPDPLNSTYLKKTIKMNHTASNVEILDYALSGQEGSAYLVQKGLNSHLVGGSSELHTNCPGVDVETITLDKLIDRYAGFSQGCDIFVKMDIEGSELDAIRGASRTLDHGAKFAIAAYHAVDGQKTHILLNKMLRMQGYQVVIVGSDDPILIAERNSVQATSA